MGEKLDFAKRFFTDEDLEELPVREGVYPYEEVDFSQNKLSASGLRTVLGLCLRCENLRILKLFKNDIDDNGAEALADFVRKCRSVEEMHLSHNRLTERGVVALVTAAEKSRPRGANPLWLRLEQNEVADPDQVFQKLQWYLSVCARKDQQRCTVRDCVNGCKVHLPYFQHQRGGLEDVRTWRPSRWNQEDGEHWPEDFSTSEWAGKGGCTGGRKGGWESHRAGSWEAGLAGSRNSWDEHDDRDERDGHGGLRRWWSDEGRRGDTRPEELKRRDSRGPSSPTRLPAAGAHSRSRSRSRRRGARSNARGLPMDAAIRRARGAAGGIFVRAVAAAVKAVER